MNMYRACRTAEAGVGMLYYLTDTDGTGGRLKADAEDFVVREVSEGPAPSDSGKYTIATVTSRNWETNRLIRMMAKAMHISRERIGYAGTKDKRAVTSQRMSFECPPSALSGMDLKDVSVSNIYRSDRQIRMGDLSGNRFSITVREIEADDAEALVTESMGIIGEAGGFPNYYGVQRFGPARPVTHLVGERIVRGDLRGAVETYLSFPSEFEGEDVSEARRMLSRCGGDFSGVDGLPKMMGYESILVFHLKKNPGDWAGAISELPSGLQMMFTHAYQSYLFNLMLSGRMAAGMPLDRPVEGDTVIPVDAAGVPIHEEPSKVTSRNIRLAERQVARGRAYVAASVFGSDGMLSDGDMGEIERSVLEKEKLSPEDFVVPGLPHCSASGSWREVLCRAEDLRVSFGEDSYSASFYLTKGNYATCLMRELMKTEMNRY